ncbi:glycerol-3-phosphate acyltransferase, partial [Clostridium sp. HCS.1]|uniref:glycerol-3-phosphate acyltransferase n=1 Tax=Clostridium sp. HCS.1 TaxID=3238594 RepID=UPI003A0FC310
MAELAGVACVIGHIFPFYLKFKGGKGFASYIGMTIALDWQFAIALIILCVILTLITDYVVSAT